jgi:hypothetical protein
MMDKNGAIQCCGGSRLNREQSLAGMSNIFSFVSGLKLPPEFIWLAVIWVVIPQPILRHVNEIIWNITIFVQIES